jgi:NAD(P)-dependent dehydrogenase (short-subunit alcohol dehydrogenase family)
VHDVSAKWGERWSGELNILVNTVGPNVQGTFDGLTDEQWRQAVDQEVMGMAHGVRSALPLLRKAEGARDRELLSARDATATHRVGRLHLKAMAKRVSKKLSLLLGHSRCCGKREDDFTARYFTGHKSTVVPVGITSARNGSTDFFVTPPITAPSAGRWLAN